MIDASLSLQVCRALDALSLASRADSAAEAIAARWPSRELLVVLTRVLESTDQPLPARQLAAYRVLMALAHATGASPSLVHLLCRYRSRVAICALGPRSLRSLFVILWRADRRADALSVLAALVEGIDLSPAGERCLFWALQAVSTALLEVGGSPLQTACVLRTLSLARALDEAGMVSVAGGVAMATLGGAPDQMAPNPVVQSLSAQLLKGARPEQCSIAGGVNSGFTLTYRALFALGRGERRTAREALDASRDCQHQYTPGVLIADLCANGWWQLADGHAAHAADRLAEAMAVLDTHPDSLARAQVIALHTALPARRRPPWRAEPLAAARIRSEALEQLAPIARRLLLQPVALGGGGYRDAS